MCNLELKIRRWFCRRVLRVHAFKISTIPFSASGATNESGRVLVNQRENERREWSLRRSVSKEQRIRTSPRTLLTRIHQANVLQRVHEVSRALFHSGSRARLTSRPAFPVEKSDLLRAPSNFLHPSTRPHQSRPAQSAQRDETPAIAFVAIP